MEPSRHLALVVEEGEALARAAERGLDAPVPACPGWDVARLVGHVARVHRWAAHVLRSRAKEPFGALPERPPAGEAVVAWYRAGLRELVDALSEVSPDEEMWDFRQTGAGARFWFRRMAIELAVHRWDAEAAHGAASPIAADLGVDGVDEFLDVHLPMLVAAGRFDDQRLSLHLHATDLAGEWLVAVGPDGVEVRREHGKGDVAVRAAASDLLLLLWNRADPTALEVFGAASSLDDLRPRLAL